MIATFLLKIRRIYRDKLNVTLEQCNFNFSISLIAMKVLRFFLMLAGLALIVWGVLGYLGKQPSDADQSPAKIILGLLGVLASFLAKNRR